MIQFVLLLLNLLGTLIVHFQRRSGHKTRAAAIDEALRTCAWSAYLGYMTSVFTYGLTRSWNVFTVLLTVTTVFVVTLLLVMLRWLLDRRRIRRVGMIKELETADLHTEDGEELVQRMFTEFDEDASGHMSISEAAKFMRTWQPGLSKRTAYAAARDHASDDGSLGFGLFLQLLVEQQQALEEKRSLRLSSADSKPSTFGLALESAASASGLALESVASAASSAATAVSTSAASAASSASGSERLRSPLSCQAESTSQVVLEASE